jgi:hypothetical protein
MDYAKKSPLKNEKDTLKKTKTPLKIQKCPNGFCP